MHVAILSPVYSVCFVAQEWFDERLVWDPSEYGGLAYTHIPSDDLWLPDIVLYNKYVI